MTDHLARRLLVALTVFVAASSIARAQTLPTTTAAIPPGPWPRDHLHLPDMPLHDPWILASAADHTYYLYTSNVARMTGVHCPPLA